MLHNIVFLLRGIVENIGNASVFSRDRIQHHPDSVQGQEEATTRSKRSSGGGPLEESQNQAAVRGMREDRLSYRLTVVGPRSKRFYLPFKPRRSDIQPFITLMSHYSVRLFMRAQDQSVSAMVFVAPVRVKYKA